MRFLWKILIFFFNPNSKQLITVEFEHTNSWIYKLNQEVDHLVEVHS